MKIQDKFFHAPAECFKIALKGANVVESGNYRSYIKIDYYTERKA